MKVTKLNKVKRFVVTSIVATLLMTGQNLLHAEEVERLYISDTILKRENEKIPLSIHRIDGNNYVPLVAIINSFGLRAEFDSDRGIVVLHADSNLDAEREFYNFLNSTEYTILESEHLIEFSGNVFEVPETKLVNGHNFVPVSALSWLFGHAVLLDRIPNTVLMTRDYFLMIEPEILEGYRDFIGDNIVDFSVDNMEALSSIIDFENYSAFLVGEGHAVSANSDIKLNFIKFLNQNYGVRHIIDEVGYFSSIMKNRFLETGDESIIHEYLETFKGTFSYTKEVYDFYMNLYEYNQTLPESERIILHGIDVGHGWESGIKIVLGILLEQNSEMPEEVKRAYDIIAKADISQSELGVLINSIDENKDIFQEYLGNDYIDFKFALRSIWQGMVYAETQNNLSARVLFIGENMRDVHTEFEIDKFFGMFGGLHTVLNSTTVEGIKNLAHFLNTEFSPTQNKVLSIRSIYVDSYYRNAQTGSSYSLSNGDNDALTLKMTMNNILDEAVSGNLAIVPTGNIASGEGFLSDASQYLLVVKGSPASTQYLSSANER